jgi:hypothetical protein
VTESLLAHQIEGWLGKLEKNLDEFMLVSKFDSPADIQFITHQYQCLMMIHMALQGQVMFVGVKPIGE